jgi:hypothetical protein
VLTWRALGNHALSQSTQHANDTFFTVAKPMIHMTKIWLVTSEIISTFRESTHEIR